jgi:hypothetical protein
MKILYISSAVPSRNGAGSNSDLTILEQLTGNNHIIDAIILKSNIDNNAIPAIFDKVYCTTTTNTGRALRSIIFPFLPGMMAFRLDILVVKKLFESKKREYDIVYFSFSPTALYVLFCKIFMKRARKIIFIHDILWQAFLRRYNNEKTIVRKLYYRIELKKLELVEFKIYKLFDKCITANVKDKEMLVNNGVMAESIIPIYKKYTYSPENTAASSFYVCYFGSFNRFENIDAVYYYLNTIHKHLSGRISNYQFIIIGLDAEKHFSNTEYVRVYGFLEDPSIVLNTCRAAVLPLRYGSGIKIKVLELLALGITCFCSTVASEGIYPTSGLVTNDDMGALSDAVYSFYKTGKSQKDKIRGEFLKTYNLESNIETINRVFYETE